MYIYSQGHFFFKFDGKEVDQGGRCTVWFGVGPTSPHSKGDSVLYHVKMTFDVLSVILTSPRVLCHIVTSYRRV